MKVMICEENPNKAKVIEDLLNVYKFKVITLTDSINFIKKVHKSGRRKNTDHLYFR
jgi:DNA-binding response OmpR family regulator